MGGLAKFQVNYKKHEHLKILTYRTIKGDLEYRSMKGKGMEIDGD